MRELAAFLHAQCAALDVPDLVLFDLELALVEAANNVVLHGYDGGGRAVDDCLNLHIAVVPGGLELALEDHGQAIPAENLGDQGPDAGAQAEHGRGLGLIAACTDRIAYRASAAGNRLILFKAVPGWPTS